MKDLVQKTITLLGGKANITAIDHCITRVRLKVADYNKVDFNGLSTQYDAAVKGVVEGSVHLVINQFKHPYTATDIAQEINALQG